MSEVNSKITFQLDGMEYPIDLADLTNREADTVCHHAKVAGMIQLSNELMAGSVAAIVALTGLAMKRAGQSPDYEKLWDLPTGAIQVADDKNPPEAGTQGAPGSPSSPESTESNPGTCTTSDLPSSEQ